MKCAEPAWEIAWVYETTQTNIKQWECQRAGALLAASYQGFTGLLRGGAAAEIWSERIADWTRDHLTFDRRGLTLSYHLRSDSGSNGLVAKKSSPLLGSWPILIFTPTKKGHGISRQFCALDRTNEPLRPLVGPLHSSPFSRIRYILPPFLWHNVLYQWPARQPKGSTNISSTGSARLRNPSNRWFDSSRTVFPQE